MSYGLLTIVMAFGVGGAGTVLQASMALNGSILGSLFGFFVLAAFYPYATSPVSSTICQPNKIGIAQLI